jgi:hypothetical protein
MVLVQVRAGRSVYDLAEGLEVSAATIFRWKKQDQIDAGAADGLSSQDGAELRAARARSEVGVPRVEDRVVGLLQLETPATIGSRHSSSVADRCDHPDLGAVTALLRVRRVQTELADAYDHVANKKLVRSIMRETGLQRATEAPQEPPQHGQQGDIDRSGEPRLQPGRSKHVVDDRHHRTPHP